MVSYSALAFLLLAAPLEGALGGNVLLRRGYGSRRQSTYQEPVIPNVVPENHEEPVIPHAIPSYQHTGQQVVIPGQQQPYVGVVHHQAPIIPDMGPSYSHTGQHQYVNQQPAVHAAYPYPYAVQQPQPASYHPSYPYAVAQSHAGLLPAAYHPPYSYAAAQQPYPGHYPTVPANPSHPYLAQQPQTGQQSHPSDPTFGYMGPAMHYGDAFDYCHSHCAPMHSLGNKGWQDCVNECKAALHAKGLLIAQ